MYKSSLKVSGMISLDGSKLKEIAMLSGEEIKEKNDIILI